MLTVSQIGPLSSSLLLMGSCAVILFSLKSCEWLVDTRDPAIRISYGLLQQRTCALSLDSCHITSYSDAASPASSSFSNGRRSAFLILLYGLAVSAIASSIPFVGFFLVPRSHEMRKTQKALEFWSSYLAISSCLAIAGAAACFSFSSGHLGDILHNSGTHFGVAFWLLPPFSLLSLFSSALIIVFFRLTSRTKERAYTTL